MSRPSTPLRRISRGSLSALSLSQSHAAAADPLAHLQPLLAEVGDAVDTLAENFAALNMVNASLDSFNENFASFLYGLKANAYTCDFTEGPTRLNFEMEAERRAAQPAQPTEADLILSQLAQSQSAPSESALSDDDGASTVAAETTFASHSGDSMASTSTSMRGRGTQVKSRGGKTTTSSQRQKLKAWIDDTLQHCPLEYREPGEARSEMERILVMLKDHPQGLRVTEVVKKSRPPLAPHRVNAALLALTRSKQVLRSNNNGVLYRLNPEKHPI